MSVQDSPQVMVAVLKHQKHAGSSKQHTKTAATKAAAQSLCGSVSDLCVFSVFLSPTIKTASKTNQNKKHKTLAVVSVPLPGDDDDCDDDDSKRSG